MDNFEDFFNQRMEDIENSEPVIQQSDSNTFDTDTEKSESENDTKTSASDIDNFAEGMEEIIISVERNPFFDADIEEIILPDEIFEKQLAAQTADINEEQERAAFNPGPKKDDFMAELLKRLEIIEGKEIELPKEEEPVYHSFDNEDDNDIGEEDYDFGIPDEYNEGGIDEDGLGDYPEGLEDESGFDEPDIPEDSEEGFSGNSLDGPETDSPVAEEPEEEDRDPAEGKAPDELTDEEMQAHFEWMKRQRDKKKSIQTPKAEPKPAAAEKKSDDVISREVVSIDAPPKPKKEKKSSGIGNFLKNSLMNEEQNEERRKRIGERERKKAERERKKEIVPDVTKIVSNIESAETVRSKAAVHKLEIALDDILIGIDKFIQNNIDTTEEIKKEIEEKEEKHAKGLPVSQPVSSESNTSSKPVDISKPESVEPPEENKAAAVQQESPEKETGMVPSETALPAKPQEVEDKVNETMENKGPIKAIRAYTNGDGEVKKANYGKIKEINRDTNAPIYFFAGIAIAAGIFVGVKANSYYNFKSLKKYHPDFIDVLWKCMFTDAPISLDPFNLGIFFGTFLIIIVILAIVGVSTFTKLKQKKESRIGHEHGDARLATPQDFMEFKKKFMDMSVSHPTKAKKK